jgi:hypothetical protein
MADKWGNPERPKGVKYNDWPLPARRANPEPPAPRRTSSGLIRARTSFFMGEFLVSKGTVFRRTDEPIARALRNRPDLFEEVDAKP